MNWNLTRVVSFGILLLMSCKSQRKTVESSSAELTSQDRIGFFMYRAYSVEGAAPLVRLMDQISVDGSIKMRDLQPKSSDSTDFVFIQLTAQGDSLSAVRIEDPLSKVIEYQSESGDLVKKRITLDSADFTVRVNLNLLTEICEIRSAKSVITLNSIKL